MRLSPIAPSDLSAEQRPLYEDMKVGINAKYNFFLALYAIYPPTRHLSVKVRLFIDFLVERFSLDAA